MVALAAPTRKKRKSDDPLNHVGPQNWERVRNRIQLKWGGDVPKPKQANFRISDSPSTCYPGCPCPQCQGERIYGLLGLALCADGKQNHLLEYMLAGVVEARAAAAKMVADELMLRGIDRSAANDRAVALFELSPDPERLDLPVGVRETTIRGALEHVKPADPLLDSSLTYSPMPTTEEWLLRETVSAMSDIEPSGNPNDDEQLQFQVEYALAAYADAIPVRKQGAL